MSLKFSLNYCAVCFDYRTSRVETRLYCPRIQKQQKKAVKNETNAENNILSI